MAEVAWPAKAEIIRQDLRLDFPGQVKMSSPKSGGTVVLDSSYGIWIGNCFISITEDGSTIEAFFNALAGVRNVVEMPLHRPTIGESANITSATAGTMILDSRPSNLEVGSYIRYEKGCYSIVAVTSGANPTITTEPIIAGATGKIDPALTMRVRSSDLPPLSPRNLSWWGPWSFSFEESRIE